MSIVLTDDTYYIEIANAIRSKNGTTTQYKPSEMAAAINAISTGGGGYDIIEGSMTRANTQSTRYCIDPAGGIYDYTSYQNRSKLTFNVTTETNVLQYRYFPILPDYSMNVDSGSIFNLFRVCYYSEKWGTFSDFLLPYFTLSNGLESFATNTHPPYMSIVRYTSKQAKYIPIELQSYMQTWSAYRANNIVYPCVTVREYSKDTTGQMTFFRPIISHLFSIVYTGISGERNTVLDSSYTSS